MERKFNVGDKVRVVKATLDRTEEHVGLVGVVVGSNKYNLGDGTYTEHDCPRVQVGGVRASYWHEPHGLELVETETPKPTPQKLNSQYLMHLAEVLTQAERAIRSKGNKYILNNPVEFYKWHQMYELCSTLEVKMRCRAEELEAQEAAQLSKAVTA